MSLARRQQKVTDLQNVTSGLIPLIIVSFFPGILWVWFFYRKDKYQPEPISLVMKAFVYGAISVFPAAFVEAPFRPFIAGEAPDIVRLFIVTTLVIGLVEEMAKFIAVRLAVYDRQEFNEVVDGIIYAVAAGLGFAAVENLFYSARFGITVGLFRAFITDLAHASFSGIVGYHLGLAKFHKGSTTLLLGKGLAIAISLHGIYDFLIIQGLVPPAFGIIMVFATYFYLDRKISEARMASPGHNPQEPVIELADNRDSSVLPDEGHPR
jgi:RsiW-degrading membrane proteinase PrsW (M82 family)